MKIEYQHNLGIEEVYQKIDNLLEEMQKRYSDKIKNTHKSWNSTNDRMDFKFEIMKFKTEGQVYLSDGKVTLEGKIPFLAKVLSGKIENIIIEQLNNILQS